jgi:hypothetical protein
MYGVETSPRGWSDYLGLAFASLLLAGLLATGVYGVSAGTLQSAAYLAANQWVAIAAGAIGAGAALYLILELGGRLNTRVIVAVCLFSGLFGIFAVTRGAPAVATALYGRPAVVAFTVTGFDWGGRGCSEVVVARNSGYEDFRLCAKYFDKRPVVGGTIELRGLASGWGLTRDEMIVR